MKVKLSEIAQIKLLGPSTTVNKGDILFRRIGIIGETILVKSRKKLDKTGTFALINVDKKTVSPEYLFTVLSSHKSSFKRKAEGTTLKTITLKKLRDHQIPLKTIIQQKSITSKFVKLLSNRQNAQTKFDKSEQNFLWQLNEGLRSRLDSSKYAKSYKLWKNFLRFIPKEQQELLIKNLRTKETYLKKLEKDVQKQERILNKFKIS